MLNIIIDSREHQLYNNIIERDLDKYKDNIKIEKKQLELGDIIIEFNEIQMIFERKTMNDLLSSINDGRYKEQKTRLLSNYTNINYLIEGTDIISSNNINKQQLLTSVYYHSIYRDNIKIFFNKNLNDTITFLLLLSTKIIDNHDNFKSSSSSQSPYIDSCKIKSKKIDNIDKETCYLLQLSQIPGISKEIAKNIKDKYSSMTILLNTLNNSPNPNKILEDIPNIGQKKAKKIIEFLL
jgi:ERCC4-type nuclease